MLGWACEAVTTRADRDDLRAEFPHRAERVLAQHAAHVVPTGGHSEDRDPGVPALRPYDPGHVTDDGTVDFSDRDRPASGEIVESSDLPDQSAPTVSASSPDSRRTVTTSHSERVSTWDRL